MISNKIKKILVPLDGSKNSFRGLDEGIFLARQCGAQLTGIFVLDRNPTLIRRRVDSIDKEILQNAEKFLEKAKVRAAQNGIDFHKIVAFGEPGSVITHFAQTKKQSIIIIGARGLSGLKEQFLGSVSNYVLHKSKIPVLIVK